MPSRIIITEAAESNPAVVQVNSLGISPGFTIQPRRIVSRGHHIIEKHGP